MVSPPIQQQVKQEPNYSKAFLLYRISNAQLSRKVELEVHKMSDMGRDKEKSVARAARWTYGRRLVL